MATTTLRCPNPQCQESVGAHDRFCESCGALLGPPLDEEPPEVESAFECPACGASLEGLEQGGNCRGCGAWIFGDRDHGEIAFPGLAGVCDRGLRHATNDDAMALAHLDARGSLALVVCDGVSTSASAGMAARVAAAAALNALGEAVRDGHGGWEAAMREAVLAAHDAVCSIPYGGPKDPPSSTLVAALVTGRRATIGWVGDSRAYFVGRQQVWQLTRDDSWSAELVAQGVMEEAEARLDPRGHVLTRWLGEDEAGPPDPSVVTFDMPGDGYLVLCSDGLWNYTPSPQRLGELVWSFWGSATPLTMAQRLTAFARDGGGHDNITVVIAAVDGGTGGWTS